MANQQCTNIQDDGSIMFIRTIYNKNKRRFNIDFDLDTGASSNQISQELAKHLRNNKSVIENTLNKENPNIVVTIKQEVSVNDNINYIHDINLPIIDKDKEYLEPVILQNTYVIKNDLYLLGQNFVEQFSEVVINPYDMQFCFVKDKNKKELKLLRQIYNKADNKNQILIDDNNPKYLSKLLLKNKDIIISINDKKYTADDITQVRYMLRYEPNLNLVIKRDNNLISVKLD